MDGRRGIGGALSNGPVALGRAARRRTRAILRSVLLLVVGLVPFVVAVPSASAGVNFLVTPRFPSPASVGQSGLPAAVSIDNHSTPPESTIAITSVTLVPSCGTQAALVDCPTASADPGVYGLGATGFGEAGTACAGTTFSIEVVDPDQGKYRFVPDIPLVLDAPGSAGAVCRINFLVDVLKVPSKDANPTAPGLQTAQLGWGLGTASTGSIGIAVGGSSTTVLGDPIPPVPAKGFLTICKAKTYGLSGEFTFSVRGRTFTLAPGQCTPAFKLVAGDATVTEAAHVGTRLANCTTTPVSRLVSCGRNARSATVRVPAGGLANQTVLTFTNRPSSGDLMVCNAAGPGVTAGQPSTFAVNGRDISVAAGPAPGGTCTPAGSFPTGAHVIVAEKVEPGRVVAAVGARPGYQVVGVADPASGQITVRIGKGVTQVTFTNASST